MPHDRTDRSSLGTIRDFYLGGLLNLHGIGLRNVTLVDLQTSQSADAIINGTVDAIIYYPPYVNAIKDRLGNNGIVWHAQSRQLTYNAIASKNDWAARHPDLINRLLKSLAQAEEHIINHPAEVSESSSNKNGSSLYGVGKECFVSLCATLRTLRFYSATISYNQCLTTI